jgi:hypothetical protein
MRSNLTPCLICEKAIVYLWDLKSSTNLNGASDIKIMSSYGSSFDCNEYHAVICDDCLDAAVQKKRVSFVQQHSLFGD